MAAVKQIVDAVKSGKKPTRVTQSVGRLLVLLLLFLFLLEERETEHCDDCCGDAERVHMRRSPL